MKIVVERFSFVVAAYNRGIRLFITLLNDIDLQFDSRT
jgi:hypothetical protein